MKHAQADCARVEGFALGQAFGWDSFLERQMKSALYLTLAYLAIALTLIIGAGFAVYDWRSK